MVYKLGIKPDKLAVELWRDADFDSVLTRYSDSEVDGAGAPAPQDWGTSDVRLIFPASNVTWTAVVVGPEATFQVDKVVVNERSKKEVVELWVGDQCWAAGKATKGGLRSVAEGAP